MSRPASAQTLAASVSRFRRDERGASAVEFAIVAGPFIVLLICVLQVGVYYMAQSALDTAVIRTADSLRNGFTSATTPTPQPNLAAIKTMIVTNAGGIIRNNTKLRVELQPLVALKASALCTGTTYCIPNNAVAYGGINDALALRARAQVVNLMPIPGLSTFLLAQSSAIVRRQGR